LVALFTSNTFILKAAEALIIESRQRPLPKAATYRESFKNVRYPADYFYFFVALYKGLRKKMSGKNRTAFLRPFETLVAP
jgi:hypothetical protein